MGRHGSGMWFGQKFRSPEAIRRQRIWRAVVAVCGVVAVGALSWGAVALWNYPKFQITSVKVLGAESLSEEEVRQQVMRALEGSYAKVLSRANVWWFPARTIQSALQERFPRIRAVSLQREGLQTLRVVVRERVPRALWCGDIVPSFYRLSKEPDAAEEYGTCYFLDRTGYLFAKAPSFTGTPLPRFYGALRRGEVVGQQFIPENDFAALLALYRMFEARELPLQGLLVADEKTMELYLQGGIRVIARRGAAPSDILEAVHAVLRAEDEKDIARTQIEYIDVRFGSKVYVKKRNGPATERTQVPPTRTTRPSATSTATATSAPTASASTSTTEAASLDE